MSHPSVKEQIERLLSDIEVLVETNEEEYNKSDYLFALQEQFKRLRYALIREVNEPNK